MNSSFGIVEIMPLPPPAPPPEAEGVDVIEVSEATSSISWSLLLEVLLLDLKMMV